MLAQLEYARERLERQLELELGELDVVIHGSPAQLDAAQPWLPFQRRLTALPDADRLFVEDQRISVIDFKTGRVPATDAEIPASHRAQMTAYAEALRVIFPGREVRAALLYTAGPKLIELTP